MIRGGEILLKRGYPQRVVEALPSGAYVRARSPYSGGRPVIGGLRNAGEVSQAMGVGLKGQWKGMRGEFVVLEPSYSKTTLTESERIFVLPVERSAGKVISFNPFAYKGLEGWARGTYSLPGQQGVGAIDVRPLTRAEAVGVMRKISSGRPVELFRVGPFVSEPKSIAVSRLPMGSQQGVVKRPSLQIFPRSPFLSLLDALRGTRQ